MKKKLFSLVMCVFLFAAAPTAGAFAQGEDEATLYHVTDSANILSDSEAETLETLASQASNKHSCSVYIIIVDDYGNYTDGSIEDASEAIFNYYKLGWGEEKNGVVLLMSMYDRDYNISAHGSLANEAFTDYGKGELADMFLDNFRSDDWYGGYVDYIRGCDELLTLREEGTPLDVSGYSGAEEELSPVIKLVLTILVPSAIAMIVCVIFLSQMKTARPKTEADDYVVPNSLALRIREDRFTHRTETRQVIESERSGGGGGTTINSGGFSHHSGKF